MLKRGPGPGQIKSFYFRLQKRGLFCIYLNTSSVAANEETVNLRRLVYLKKCTRTLDKQRQSTEGRWTPTHILVQGQEVIVLLSCVHSQLYGS
ncbi:unnamed protein product, partial [Amoebophrya sp. A25]|eukprot:GSA25T00007838001.1